MKRILNTFAVLMAFFVLLLPSAYAAEAAGSITVTPRGATVTGALTLYRVADVVSEDGNEAYALTEEFAGSDADVSTLDEADALAETLAAYAEAHGLSGTTQNVDAEGSVRFVGLPKGLYLVAQASVEAGSGFVRPFLVSVPYVDGDAISWDVDASPKADTYELVSITVNKVWNDGDDAASRPASVEISLYRGDTLVDTVTLTAASGWTHTWTGLEKSDSYAVSETRLKDYAATYRQDGTTFTVTNTPALPYTGQLTWPIPVLAGAGLVLFGLGWALARRGKQEP